LGGFEAKKKGVKMIDIICELVAEGKSFDEIARMDKMMPKREIMRLLRSDKSFQVKLFAAMQTMQLDNFSQLIGIADGSTREDVQVAKLQIETRKWCMERVAKELFSPKVLESNESKSTALEDEKLFAELNERMAKRRKLANVVELLPADTPHKATG